MIFQYVSDHHLTVKNSNIDIFLIGNDKKRKYDYSRILEVNVSIKSKVS